MAFKKGQSGNPAGRKKGFQTARTRFRGMFEEAGVELVPKLIQLAKDGNMEAMKMCMERIAPKVKDNSIDFDLPNLVGMTPEQLVKALFEEMSGQTMSADEINCVLNMIKTFRSDDDQIAVKNMIIKSNEMLEILRPQYKKEY